MGETNVPPPVARPGDRCDVYRVQRRRSWDYWKVKEGVVYLGQAPGYWIGRFDRVFLEGDRVVKLASRRYVGRRRTDE